MEALVGALGGLLVLLMGWLLKVQYQVAQDVRVLRFAVFGNGARADGRGEGKALPLLPRVRELEARLEACEEALGRAK